MLKSSTKIPAQPASTSPVFVAKHFDMVVGLDIHVVLLGGFPVPLPYPHIGFVLDPADYLHFSIPIPSILQSLAGGNTSIPLGGTVYFNGMHRGATTTSTVGLFPPIVDPHIPFFGPFLLPFMCVNDGEIYYGSETVLAQQTELSGLFCKVLTCWDAGMMLPAAPRPKMRLPIAMYMDTLSILLAVPAGLPVFVGGSKVPHKFTAKELLTRLVCMIGMKKLADIAGKLMKSMGKLLDGLLDIKIKAKKIRCHLGLEPVNLVTGAMYYEGIDFELPGPIPLRWERNWYSDSNYEGCLGHGCHLSYDLVLKVSEELGGIALTLPDGRGAEFPLLEIGESHFDRSERLTLTRHKAGYLLFDHETRLRYVYSSFSQSLIEVHKAVQIRDERGFKIDLKYNQLGHLYKIIDSVGRLIDLGIDSKGRIEQVAIHHDGHSQIKVLYQYNDEGDLVAIIDANGKPTQMRYEQHLMVEKKDRNGQAFYWEYDKQARVVHSWGDHGILEGWLEYRDGFNVLTNSLGQKSIYFFDENNLCTQITDALGNSRFFEHTPFQELLREIDEEGNITEHTYDKFGNEVKAVLPDGSARTFVFNENGKLESSMDAAGNLTTYHYNDGGLVSAVINSVGSKTTFDYNEYGELAVIGDSRGFETRLFYDEDHNLAEMQLPDGNNARWSYDCWGNCIESVNPNHQRQSFGYDRLGRVTKIRLPDSNVIDLEYNAYENVTHLKDRLQEVHFAYTPLGSLKMREQNGVKVHFGYDTEEQLRTIRNEHNEYYRFERNVRGDIHTEIGFDGMTRRYARNRSGRVLRIERPDDRWTEYQYDDGGRITRTQYYDGSWETYKYDANGQLIEAVNETSIAQIKRNANGQVIEEFQNGHLVSSTITPSGFRTRLRSSLGADIELERDLFGDVSGIAASANNSETWNAKIRRNAMGQEVERILTGGVVSTWEYNAAGLPMQHSVNSGMRSIRNRSYDWDVNSRLTQMVNDLSGGRVIYGHDAFGNLAWSQYEDGSYDYKLPDEVGNLFKTKERTDRKYGAGGRLLECQDYMYTYDAEGNLVRRELKTGGGAWVYHWSGNGMLKEVERPDRKSASFEYDGFGRRTAKIFDNKITRWVWDGNVPLHEYTYPITARPQLVVNELGQTSWSGSDPIHTNQLITWIFDDGKFSPAAKIIGEKRYSIITDYLGTPVQMYDSQGKLAWEAEYDIYGKIRKLAAGSLNDCPFRFPGQYEDAETGLYYNRFRYYSPEVGGYICQDPIGLRGNNPNIYSYVGNSNVEIDRFGLMPSWMSKLRGYQRHHIIPNSLKNHPAFKQSGMNIDGATNMKYLPVAEGIDPNPNKSIHHGWNDAHLEYNQKMKGELDSIYGRSILENWDQQRLQQEILHLQRKTRADLDTGRIKCG